MAKNSWTTLLPYLAKIKDYSHLIAILDYDIQTNTPPRQIDEENALFEKVAGEQAKISQDPAYIAALTAAKADPSLTPMQQKVVKERFKQVELLEVLSLKDYLEYSRVTNLCNAMWRKYRPLNDFKNYLPYWEAQVAWQKKVFALLRKPEHKTLYDVALNLYEPGNDEVLIDSLFNPLKEFLIAKLHEVLAKQAKKPSLPILPYSVDQQRHLSYALLKLIDYDMDEGCLRESAHPFSDWIGRYDARITTKFLVEDWRSNAFTCLHEGGHCLEFQNWSEEEFANYADALATSAICETHSRFYENLIGRSEEFAPLFQKAAAENLDPKLAKIKPADFAYMVNKIEPGLIRCEADELTYSLHIIIRYEIERDLTNGVISCKDVPALWAKKYKNYLGVVVPNDKDGCMQDVHWSQGSIGYFPSYALGNIYGAQILHALKKDLDFSGLVKANKLHDIKLWFRDHDFCYDWMDPRDWIKQVTGEAMDIHCYIDYLDKKF
jgi:carboxypeptidase Taq